MKLIDKIKNYFCDDEEDASKKHAPTKVEQSSTRAKPEVKDEKTQQSNSSNTNVDTISERELFRSDPTFNFPIIFDDEDFKDEKLNNSRISITKKEQTKTVEVVEKKVFKPSPNISPIYGVISSDTKAEKPNSSENLLNLYDENKKIDIDDILGRVYDQTRVEIKKENYTEVKGIFNTPVKEDSSFDFFNNIETEPREEIKTKVEITRVSTKNVDEKLKTIDELLDNTDEEDFYSLVDSMYKENDEEGDN